MTSARPYSHVLHHLHPHPQLLHGLALLRRAAPSHDRLAFAVGPLLSTLPLTAAPRPGAKQPTAPPPPAAAAAPSLTPRELATLLWDLAVLQHPPDAAWLQQFWTALQRASSRAPHDLRGAEEAAAGGRGRGRGVALRDVAQLLWAAAETARARPPPPALLRGLLEAAVLKAPGGGGWVGPPRGAAATALDLLHCARAISALYSGAAARVPPPPPLASLPPSLLLDPLCASVAAAVRWQRQQRARGGGGAESPTSSGLTAQAQEEEEEEGGGGDPRDGPPAGWLGPVDLARFLAVVAEEEYADGYGAVRLAVGEALAQRPCLARWSAGRLLVLLEAAADVGGGDEGLGEEVVRAMAAELLGRAGRGRGGGGRGLGGDLDVARRVRRALESAGLALP